MYSIYNSTENEIHTMRNLAENKESVKNPSILKNLKTLNYILKLKNPSKIRHSDNKFSNRIPGAPVPPAAGRAFPYNSL